MDGCDRPGCETTDIERGVMHYTGRWTEVDGKPVEMVRIYCSQLCLDAHNARLIERKLT